jgi:hypothetical protein
MGLILSTFRSMFRLIGFQIKAKTEDAMVRNMGESRYHRFIDEDRRDMKEQRHRDSAKKQEVIKINRLKAEMRSLLNPIIGDRSYYTVRNLQEAESIFSIFQKGFGRNGWGWGWWVSQEVSDVRITSRPSAERFKGLLKETLRISDGLSTKYADELESAVESVRENIRRMTSSKDDSNAVILQTIGQQDEERRARNTVVIDEPVADEFQYDNSADNTYVNNNGYTDEYHMSKPEEINKPAKSTSFSLFGNLFGENEDNEGMESTKGTNDRNTAVDEGKDEGEGKGKDEGEGKGKGKDEGEGKGKDEGEGKGKDEGEGNGKDDSKYDDKNTFAGGRRTKSATDMEKEYKFLKYCFGKNKVPVKFPKSLSDNKARDKFLLRKFTSLSIKKRNDIVNTIMKELFGDVVDIDINQFITLSKRFLDNPNSVTSKEVNALVLRKGSTKKGGGRKSQSEYISTRAGWHRLSNGKKVNVYRLIKSGRRFYIANNKRCYIGE